MKNLKRVLLVPRIYSGYENTFDFLGFTHFWARTRAGYWVKKRKTAKKKMRKSIVAMREWCQNNRHKPIKWQRQMLASKLEDISNISEYGVICAQWKRYDILSSGAGSIGSAEESTKVLYHGINLSNCLKRFHCQHPKSCTMSDSLQGSKVMRPGSMFCLDYRRTV
jgi:hypothetical protein